MRAQVAQRAAALRAAGVTWAIELHDYMPKKCGRHSRHARHRQHTARVHERVTGFGVKGLSIVFGQNVPTVLFGMRRVLVQRQAASMCSRSGRNRAPVAERASRGGGAVSHDSEDVWRSGAEGHSLARFVALRARRAHRLRAAAVRSSVTICIQRHYRSAQIACSRRGRTLVQAFTEHQLHSDIHEGGPEFLFHHVRGMMWNGL